MTVLRRAFAAFRPTKYVAVVIRSLDLTSLRKMKMKDKYEIIPLAILTSSTSQGRSAEILSKEAEARKMWQKNMDTQVGEVLCSKIMKVNNVKCLVTALELKHPRSAVAFSFVKSHKEIFELLFKWFGVTTLCAAYLLSLCSFQSAEDIPYVLVAAKNSGSSRSLYLTRKGYFQLALEID